MASDAAQDTLCGSGTRIRLRGLSQRPNTQTLRAQALRQLLSPVDTANEPEHVLTMMLRRKLRCVRAVRDIPCALSEVQSSPSVSSKNGGMADPVATMPQNVRVRLNVGGTPFHTSLHTLMEGARRGAVVFQCLCVQILGPEAHTPAAAGGGAGGVAWEQRVVRVPAEQARMEHFIDADAGPFAHWLSYLRTGEAPFVAAGPERERIIRETERAGLGELAAEMREQVDWRRAELQALLVQPGRSLCGARLQGQDLSGLGFVECILVHADLSDCNLSRCCFRG